MVKNSNVNEIKEVVAQAKRLQFIYKKLLGFGDLECDEVMELGCDITTYGQSKWNYELAQVMYLMLT